MVIKKRFSKDLYESVAATKYVHTNGTLSDVPYVNLPHGLNNNPSKQRVFWPPEWLANNPIVMPSVFWPKKHEIIFIDKSGTSLGHFIFSSIKENNYWENRKKQLLNMSRTFFVGMFHMEDNIYAIGTEVGKSKSTVFILEESNDGKKHLKNTVRNNLD